MALADSLVSYWKFDESSGDAADALLNNTLTNHNTCTYGAVKINNGVILSAASSQYLDTPDDNDYDGKTNFSISFWINPTATTDDMMPVTKWGTNSATDQSWRVIFFSNKLTFIMTNTSATTGTITPISTLSTSTLYHIVFTYDGSQSAGSRGKVYINGSGNTASDDTPSTMLSGTAGLIVGNRTGLPSGGYFSGKMDELGIWTRTLSSTEVASLYAGGSGLQYPFLMYYTLACGAGSFSLTGISNNLLRGYLMACSVASFTLSGISAILRKGYVMACAVGSFILTGLTTTLRKSFWIDRTKPSTTFTNRTKPTTSFTDRTKPTTTWTKIDKY